MPRPQLESIILTPSGEFLIAAVGSRLREGLQAACAHPETEIPFRPQHHKAEVAQVVFVGKVIGSIWV